MKELVYEYLSDTVSPQHIKVLDWLLSFAEDDIVASKEFQDWAKSKKDTLVVEKTKAADKVQGQIDKIEILVGEKE